MIMLNVVARQLGYTWLSESAAQLISDQIDEGLAYLQRYDPAFDPAANAFDRSLLVEYVRYAHANSRDDFKKNYREELLSLSDRAWRARCAASGN